MTVNRGHLLVLTAAMLAMLVSLARMDGGLVESAMAQSPASAPAGRVGANTIVEIRVQGNRQLSQRSVLSRIRIRVGQPFDAELIKQDVQLLLQSRRYDSVTTMAQQAPGGGVILTFVVIERPMIKSITITGNKKFKTKDLLKDLDFSSGDAVDRQRIEHGRQGLQDKYRQAGYRDASVAVDDKELTQHNAVLYIVTEGPQTTIRKIVFDGNTYFLDIKLKFAVESSTRFWPFVDGYLDMDKVDSDVNILRNMYIDEGFLDAEVGRDIEFLKPDKSKAKLIFRIRQGPRYRVNEIRFRGNKVFANNELAKRLQLHQSAFYTKVSLQRDIKAIQDAYGELGFIDARVDAQRQFLPPNIPLPPWSAELDKGKPALLNVVFTIVEEDQFNVGKIVIRGNTITQDRVIRREMRFYPLQLFNTVAVEESRRVLQESGLFEPKSVTITPMAAAEGRVRDALVNVKEANTAQFTVGVGVSSNDGLIGDVSFVQHNFDIQNPGGLDGIKRGTAWKGAGQTFRVDLRPGTEVNSASVEWFTPYIGDLPYSYGSKLFLFDRRRECYTETRAGLINSIGHYFFNDWKADLSNRIEGVDIHKIDDFAPKEVVDDEGTSLVVGLKGGLTRDRSDSRLLPSKGDKLRVSYEQVTGSFNFGVAEADYRFYHTLWTDALDRKHILATRVAAGQIIGNDAPVFEKFYGGGTGSLRGFKYRGIGPTGGLNNDPIGGNFSFFLGTEYTFPIFGEQLRGVLFVDTGTVEDSPGFSHYRAAVGPGIRWVIPIFGQVPIDLDFGFPLLKSDHDDTQIFSFNMGVTF